MSTIKLSHLFTWRAKQQIQPTVPNQSSWDKRTHWLTPNRLLAFSNQSRVNLMPWSSEILCFYITLRNDNFIHSLREICIQCSLAAVYYTRLSSLKLAGICRLQSKQLEHSRGRADNFKVWQRYNFNTSKSNNICLSRGTH